MPDDPHSDPFAPPEVPTEVCCLHCGQTYESWQIEWRELTDLDHSTDPDQKLAGFWCCPTPGCDGMGFGFDILPTDPDYQDERGGWAYFDDQDEDDEDWDEEEQIPGDLPSYPGLTGELPIELPPPPGILPPSDDWPFSMN